MVSGPGVWREAARASCPSAQAPTLVASGAAHLPLARFDPKLLHTGCSEVKKTDSNTWHLKKLENVVEIGR